MNNKEILEKDNCESVRVHGEEVCIKVVSLRTETLYKAGAMGRGGIGRERSTTGQSNHATT